jgi:hypothetical protein
MEQDTKAWYLSKTVWGGILAIAASGMSLAGVDLGALDQAELADQIPALLGAVGGIIAVAGRLSARRKLR